MTSSQMYLAVIGIGGVSKCFLSQLASLPKAIQPKLIFISRSSAQLYSRDYTPISPLSAEKELQASKAPLLSIPDLVDYLQNAPDHIILADNTSNQDIADAYPAFLKAGVSIVTPNKKAFSSGLDLWDAIFGAVANAHGRTLVYHESSVGAGMPVISTLNDLVATGDKVKRIEGVFSGTMSFLFNEFAPLNGQGGRRWSEIVDAAKNAGFTEPDPRDDLNGMDVARKMTILARLAGLRVSGPTGFPVQSLIPKELESVGSSAEFLQRLPEFDEEMEAYKVNAEKQGKLVRYLGSVDIEKGEVKVGLEQVARDGPIAGLKGSDNLMCFYTERYGSRPLVVQGAGAGGEVTAMGVLADLLKVIERLR